MTTPPSPIRWPAEALWEALAPSLPGFTVEVLPEIDSSNTELMRRFRGSPRSNPGPNRCCWWPSSRPPGAAAWAASGKAGAATA
jgi:hypothetical protein